MCAAGAGGQGPHIDYCAPGDTFSGRSIRFHTTADNSLGDVPDLQNIGDCCRRLLGSHGVDVQVLVCREDYRYDVNFAKVVECLAPHLSGILLSNDWGGVRLQPLLPAAAQLEQVTCIVSD